MPETPTGAVTDPSPGDTAGADVEQASSDTADSYSRWRPDSPDIECVWQARSSTEERYLTPAVEYWDLWFTRQSDGAQAAGISGPALGHRWARSMG